MPLAAMLLTEYQGRHRCLRKLRASDRCKGSPGGGASMVVTSLLLFPLAAVASKIKAITQETVNGRLVHSQVNEIQKNT